MYYYKAIIAYDGTDYCGWQLQKDELTVAGALQKSFYSTFGQPVTLVGVSRTDAGVHASGQVALIKTPLNLDVAKMRFAWNNKLPSSIHIRRLKAMDAHYNPFENIDYKVYHYLFFTYRPDPRRARHGLHVRKKVDIARLNQALQLFVGTHDFRSFCTGDEREDTVRTIQTIHVTPIGRYNGYRIHVQGVSFLRYMIRRLVGACLAYATSHDMPLSYLQEILDRKDPCHPLPNASPQGLTLHAIKYKNS